MENMNTREFFETYLGLFRGLECPVCYNIMFTDIYQCESGHALCNNCKPSVNNECPICRKKMSEIRARNLESISESLKFPCSNKGCTELSYLKNLKEHEENCQHEKPETKDIKNSHLQNLTVYFEEKVIPLFIAQVERVDKGSQTDRVSGPRSVMKTSNNDSVLPENHTENGQIFDSRMNSFMKGVNQALTEIDNPILDQKIFENFSDVSARCSESEDDSEQYKLKKKKKYGFIKNNPSDIRNGDSGSDSEDDRDESEDSTDNPKYASVKTSSYRFKFS